jgi:hypothetical protein
MRWLYVAESVGRGRIGEARVFAAGRTLRTDPIEIVVGPSAGPSTIPPPPGVAEREDLFVRAVVRPERPYVGQQVVVDYVLYFRRHLEPRSAQFVGAWQADGLWREELDVPPSARSPRHAGNGYWTVTVRRVALYPTRTGRVTLGELSFEIELIRRRADPFGLFGAFSSRVERTTPVAEAVELDVRPLPPGAPRGFSGAVGRFTLRATLDREEAAAGEPLRLTAIAEGTGNLATLPPPTIEAPVSFERYDPDEDRTLDRTSAPATGTKTWTWSLVPRSGGRFRVGVELAYFDPAREMYRTLEVGPIDVRVTGTVDPLVIAADGPAPAMAQTEWVRAPSGRPGVGWLAAGAALPLLALAGLAAGTRVRRPRRRPAAPQPLASARAAIDDPAEFYRRLAAALSPLAGGRDGAPEETRRARELLLTAERAQFAPGDPPPLSMRLQHLAIAEGLVAARGRPAG